MSAPTSQLAPQPLSALITPAADESKLFELGILGIPLCQYLRWADDAGLFAALASRERASLDDVIAQTTTLNERGVDAFLGVLCALGIVARDADGSYALNPVGREYLDRSSPFYMGLSLYGMLNAPLPARMVNGAQPHRFSDDVGTLKDRIQFHRNQYQWGRPERLRIQHSRNFPSGVVAARTGYFDGVKHLVDIGGGTGVFAIPLALDHPEMRITLVDLPRSLPQIAEFLEPYGASTRVELCGFNVFSTPWPLQECDAILMANFLHSCADDECRLVLRESFRQLPPGGRILVHETFWNERKDGPLVTALWNFWLINVSAGRQRSASELSALLADAGFTDFTVTPTSGSLSLLRGIKPA